MADADVVVVVLDGSAALATEDLEVLEATRDLARVIAVNKIDMAGSEGFDEVLSGEGAPVVRISALGSEGLDELKEAVIAPFSPSDVESSGFLVSDARHHDLLRRAAKEVRESVGLIERGTSEEITLVGLHNAIRYLGEITGETTTEDMLTRIFQTFCIGK